MRIVCLSNMSDGPGFVVRRVLAAFPSAKLLQIRAVPRRSTLRRKLRGLARGAWIRKLEQRCYYQGYFARGLKQLDERLYGPEGPPPVAAIKQIASTEVNLSTAATCVASLRPDVLLVAGAPILRPSIFTIPRLAAINVHFGIAPWYRGEHTLFWPLYYGDEKNVGVTVHLIDKGIDTGRMLAQGFVGVAADDDEWAIEAKAARTAADVVVKVLQRGEFEPSWQPTRAGRGRVYNYSDRHVWHDVRLARRRRQGLTATAPRQIDYCRPAVSDESIEAELLAMAAL
ncbi:MAG: formyl transferase [Pirellulaceae bacterium]